MSESTVIRQKQAFLRRQKQILAKGIAPSPRLVAIANEAGIQTKVLSDIMLKVNRDLKRHSREYHSKQMTDHVVEQIDMMYWEAGAPALDADSELHMDGDWDDSTTLCKGDDLSVDKNISKLPPTWDTSADPPSGIEGEGEEVNQDAYIEAAARLQDLSARRLTLQQKLTTYRTILTLLEPYRKPQENIQPNLVGRDAPLAAELNKTRTLAIRVAGRIVEKYGDVQVSASAEDEEMDLEEQGSAKLDKILSTW